MENSNFENEIKIQQKIKMAFEESGEPSKTAYDIAFHMTDWLSDIRDLQETYSKINGLDNDEIMSFVYKFLAHVPDHLNAAMKLSGMGKVEDIFQVGIFEEDK